MMMMFCPFDGRAKRVERIYFVIFAVIFLTGTYADEITDNTVSLSFSDVTVASWNSDGRTTKFKDAMSAVANGYCPNNLDKCALKLWNLTRVFQNTDVILTSGYPKQQDDNLELRFYITLPLGSDIRKDSRTVLPKSVLEHMISTNRTHVSFAVGVSIATPNGSSNYDDTLNYIMIPVSFGILLILCLIACCLHICQKRKSNAVREQRKGNNNMQMENKPSTSKYLSPAMKREDAEVPNVTEPRKSPQGDRNGLQEHVASSQHDSGILSPSRANKKPRKPRKGSDEDGDGTRRNGGYIRDEADGSSSSSSDEELDHGSQGTSSPHDEGREPRKNRRHKKKKKAVSPVEHIDEVDDDNRRDGKDVLPTRLPPIRKLPPLSDLRNTRLHNEPLPQTSHL